MTERSCSLGVGPGDLGWSVGGSVKSSVGAFVHRRGTRFYSDKDPGHKRGVFCCRSGAGRCFFKREKDDMGEMNR